MANLSGWYFSNLANLSGNKEALTPEINWYNTNTIANGYKMTNLISRKLDYNISNIKNELYKTAINENNANNSGGSGYLNDILNVAGNGLIKSISGNQLIISANSSIMEYIGSSTFENLSILSATANVGDVYNLTTSRTSLWWRFGA